MKNYIIIGIMGLMLQSCAGRKHAAPCKQCPHYSNGYDYPIKDVELSAEFIEELKLNLIKSGIIVPEDSIK